MDEARRDAQVLHDGMTNKARAEIQAEKERLVREMDRAKDQAVKELWTQSAQLATLISAKTIRRQLTEEDHRRLVDEALVELGKARTGRMG
jgi:F-type H+-transporting ATPase subunit b